MTSQEERKPDVDAIPAGLMRWEWLLFIYAVFAGFLVWYVSEKLLVWEPEGNVWGLPKPIAGALMMSITWIILNWVLFVVYYVVMKKRIREVGEK
jgi:membrane protein DedA with SNARE-associated domain